MRNLMKFMTFSICLMTMNVNAQIFGSRSDAKNADHEYYDREFSSDEGAFAVTEIPEKYKGESTVVLAKKTNIIYDYQRAVFMVKIASRERVYLNDQSAVNDYSEYYFRTANSVELSVVKPGGESTNVDLSDAVEVNADVPRRYRDRYRGGSYYKIAIPNLEVGDIVDYYTEQVQMAIPEYQYYIPVTAPTPILHQEVVIDVCKGWELYHGSVNGAPEMVIDDGYGYNIKGDQNKKYTRLIFSSGNMERANEERWRAPEFGDPAVKVLVRPRVEHMRAKSEIYSSVSSMDHAMKRFEIARVVMNYFGKKVPWHLKKIDKAYEDDLAFADAAYETVRFAMLKEMAQIDANQSALISTELSRNSTQIDDALFAVILGEALEKAKLVCDVVVVQEATKNEDDFVLPKECHIGIYVPSIDRYYISPTIFSVAGEMPSSLEGLSMITFPFSEVKKIKDLLQRVKSGKVPQSVLEDNVYAVEATATLAEDNTITYNGTIETSGYFRQGYASLFLYNNHFMKDVYREIFIDKYLKNSKKDTYRSLEELKSNELEAYRDASKKHMETLEGWLTREHGDVKLSKYEVLNNGMEGGNLKVAYTFESSDLVTKAGPNLICKLGQLSGDQLQLERDELEGRVSDVRFDCPRSITTSTKLTIPDGMQANGLEDINMKIDNEVGFFECKAVQEGNTITMTTVKNYKQSQFSADKWPLMVEFLEAAYEQCQKKIILK